MRAPDAFDLEAEIEQGGPPTVACKYCGETCVHWTKTDDGYWRLADDIGGALHKCNGYRRPS